MTRITITPWDEDARRHYNRAAPYKADVEPENRLQAILGYVDNMVVQLRNFTGPRGIHFGDWAGNRNDKTNLRGNHALALDYRVEQFETLRDAAEQLGYARFWMTGENKARTINTITLVIPFTNPVGDAVYERVASVIAKKLDTYGMIEGALTATHIVNIHATTLTGFERGPVLDAEAFKHMTAKLCQERDAVKYYRETRPVRAADVQLAKPVVTSECGLLQF